MVDETCAIVDAADTETYTNNPKYGVFDTHEARDKRHVVTFGGPWSFLLVQMVNFMASLYTLENIDECLRLNWSIICQLLFLISYLPEYSQIV